jgi:hypothetical protein
MGAEHMRCVSLSFLCANDCAHVLLSRLRALEGASLLQQLRKFGLLGLQVAVTANVLLADEDVRDRALAGYLLQRILDSGTIIWIATC